MIIASPRTSNTDCTWTGASNVASDFAINSPDKVVDFFMIMSLLIPSVVNSTEPITKFSLISTCFECNADFIIISFSAIIFDLARTSPERVVVFSIKISLVILGIDALSTTFKVLSTCKSFFIYKLPLNEESSATAKLPLTERSSVTLIL